MSTTQPHPTDDRWAATSFLSRCKDRFLKGWHDLPEDAAKHWLIVFAGGFALCLVLMGGMASGVKALSGGTHFAWEPNLLRWFEDSVPAAAAQWMSVLGNSIMLWPMMIFAAGMAAWRKKPLTALSIFPGYPVTQLIVFAGWWVWSRSSPTFLATSSTAKAFNAFPSGHVAHAVFAFGILSYLWWRVSDRPGEKLVAILVWIALAGSVSWGRVATAAHWPTDVLAAWVIGLAWLLVQVVALRIAEPRS
ncbi:phosphatase PAP2 family protein [Persicimonas caeni]|uniref:Phosphatase PAP2 family protein n=1 Tax=Persicimonas caeni TaxID=2292766 RepID=A0A4Y6PZ54_PERCE|nr:phosphatase PAP2 family protein [Persicimonas caeni]QDG53449.1 phosphatase PAP2 family protein [Persicimonas caeni]QED34670.1 phosphatase PAP2 family protein [Persicimonas caeni]